MKNDKELFRKLCVCLEYSLDTKLFSTDKAGWREEIKTLLHCLGYTVEQWPNEKFGYFNDFCTNLMQRADEFLRRHREYVGEAGGDFGETGLPPKDECKWPHCKHKDDNLQKDHILPKSFFTADWVSDPTKNMMWLCPYHNRMKTNSIGIGIMFALTRREGLWKHVES